MSEDRRKWSEVSDDEIKAAKRESEKRVTGPGTALVIIACLAVGANFMLHVVIAASRPSKGPPERPPGMDDETYRAYERGRAAAPLFDCCMTGVPTLGIYSLMLAGGIQMLRLKNHWLAVTASILVLLPCSPMCLFGLPIGVWALVVLFDPAVKDAFKQG